MIKFLNLQNMYSVTNYKSVEKINILNMKIQTGKRKLRTGTLKNKKIDLFLIRKFMKVKKVLQ